MKPIGTPRDVYGSKIPMATISSTVMMSGRLGRLRRGLPVVRMINTTSVCAQSDSTNQPVWKITGPALKTCNKMKKVRKSKIELSGPTKIIKLRSRLIFQCCGFLMKLGSTLSGEDG